MIKLDNRDLDILKVLSREGRISKADLAKRINLSPSPCWKRLERLESAGIIEGYSANISLKNLGPHVTVFVTVELEHHRAEYFQKFERAIREYEAVTACWAIGGGLDYLMQIVARDIDAYQRFMDALLDRELSVVRYFTYVVTKPVKQNAGLPLDDLYAGLLGTESDADRSE
ncbi:Lrp/AsnC family transcriptional regulator [Roseibium salinum]|uniref:Lrp/AsnC family transcriptional regulator n=1 Tax=Roseibium salinum TaxID=1604349 RepID=A0ABT3R0L5_9HYPH|nr:Lrp/AsnC family transcriptional regulator [Roseibium sp. DSM 29163]MCX2722758.1 Lrp/AsnC family transcriptional regulator [Roseibium sp. DSM 29163]